MAIYKIDEVCELIKGDTPIQKSICGKYPLVVTAEERLTNENYQLDCKAVCIPLVSSTGHGHASINRIHYQEGKFALGSILVAVIPKDENYLKAEYLYVYLSYMKDLILVPLMKGSANVSLTITALKSAEIEVPSLELQENIIKLAKDMKNHKEILNNVFQVQLNNIIELRQSILQEAIQGKLVPQDPNDEPASVLLGKVKEKKQELIKERKLREEKPLPPITKNEIPYELPNGWEWVRLGDVLTVKGGKRLPVGEQLTTKETSHIYIRVTDMKNQTIDDSNLHYISDNAYAKISNYIIEKDDIYIVIVGSTIGKVGIVTEKFHLMNLTENAARLIPICLNKNYLLNSLMSKFLQAQMLEKTNQVGQPKLALIRLKNSIFPIPPLNEQLRIVQKTNQLMSLCDELNINIEQSKKDSEMLTQSVLQEAFKDNSEEDNEISFGEFIKQKRKDKGITVTDMLKLLEDVKSSEYTKIEEGLVKPEKIVIEKIARELELSETEVRLFEKLKIRANIDEYSDPNYDIKIAARRVNKN